MIEAKWLLMWILRILKYYITINHPFYGAIKDTSVIAQLGQPDMRIPINMRCPIPNSLN